MQASGGEAGGVTDVVQPGGGFDQVGVRAEKRCQAAGPGGDAWTCAQRRGRGSCRSAPVSCSAQEASVFMSPRLDSYGGTFTDMAWLLV